MSYTIDVNILLYASDRTSPFYAAAADFLRNRSDDPEILCLTWSTIMGYIRLATHPRVFDNPMSSQQAIDNIIRLIEMPRCRVIVENEDFLTSFREVAAGVTTRGNLVPDAHLATMMHVHDVRTIYTHDRDFLKFTFLKVIDPV
ncbi:MAG: PIN domain-containing protein [Gammaproteobacteria bacterium]|nr:PIN domain-containing protein [Gammaproteobacteria bacterium]MDE0513487.1 PIN domain-containing protein [Gammaproteobacteria bacterium]